MVRKPRGTYAGLICLRCRARKIKCILPPGVQVSHAAQPAALRCQRCQQHDFDCVVDSTTLGRPSKPRVELVEGEAAQFILDQPLGEEGGRPPVEEQVDALVSPGHLLHALLVRSAEFASRLPHTLLPKATVEISPQVLSLLDEHLVWYRFYYPYIPPLTSLRSERSCTKLLLALLCDLALDVPSPRLDSHRYLQPSLRSLVYHQGQSALFRPFDHRHTVLAMELLGEYRPLAVVTAAPSAALTNGLYSMIAKMVAERLRLAEGDAMDQLQWTNVLTAELEARPLLFRVDTLIDYLDKVRLPDLNLPLVHLRRIYIHGVESTRDIVSNSSDMTQLSSILTMHVAADEQLRRSFPTDATTHAILSAELHRHAANVRARALFFAVMASAHPGFARDDAADITKHLIHRLTSEDQTDPNRHPARIFLEKFGPPRMDELEKQLTDFATLTQITLDGVPWLPPIRRIASETVFICKQIVDNQAARLKGWGAFHPRVDTHLILFEEAARRLEGLKTAGIDQGDVPSASAKLIRSLHRIITTWKQRYAAQGMGLPLLPHVESDSTDFGDSTDSNSQHTPSDSELFADWEQWPQLDNIDFTDLLSADMDMSWLESYEHC